MSSLSLAWRTIGDAPPQLISRPAGDFAGPVRQPTQVAIYAQDSNLAQIDDPSANAGALTGWSASRDQRLKLPALVSLDIQPANSSVTVRALSRTLHFFRLADATIKPLANSLSTLWFMPGDTYIAVTPGAAWLAEAGPGGASAAVARYIHLHDSFNADKLAVSLLAYLEALANGCPMSQAGVLVLEGR